MKRILAVFILIFFLWGCGSGSPKVQTVDFSEAERQIQKEKEDRERAEAKARALVERKAAEERERQALVAKQQEAERIRQEAEDARILAEQQKKQRQREQAEREAKAEQDEAARAVAFDQRKAQEKQRAKDLKDQREAKWAEINAAEADLRGAQRAEEVAQNAVPDVDACRRAIEERRRQDQARKETGIIGYQQKQVGGTVMTVPVIGTLPAQSNAGQMKILQDRLAAAERESYGLKEASRRATEVRLACQGKLAQLKAAYKMTYGEMIPEKKDPAQEKTEQEAPGMTPEMAVLRKKLKAADDAIKPLLARYELSKRGLGLAEQDARDAKTEFEKARTTGTGADQQQAQRTLDQAFKDRAGAEKDKNEAERQLQEEKQKWPDYDEWKKEFSALTKAE